MRSLAILDPVGLTLMPQRLDPPAYDAVLELVAATGSSETTSAPWWASIRMRRPGRRPDNVTYLGRRLRSWGSADTGGQEVIMETVRRGQRDRAPSDAAASRADRAAGRHRQPAAAGGQAMPGVLRLAARAPGTTAQAMGAALASPRGPDGRT